MTKARKVRKAELLLHKVMRGCVRNVQHSHPDWIIDERFERSIAKRAVGTIRQIPSDVLLAPTEGVSKRRANFGNEGRLSNLPGVLTPRRALRGAQKALGDLARILRLEGNAGQVKGVEDILRTLDALGIESIDMRRQEAHNRADT